MLKSLKDIPYPKLRQLARKRIKERKISISGWDSPLTFDWRRTPEGLEFWNLVQRGNYRQARKLQPELFTALPRSKKQELAWTSGSVLGSIAMADASLGRVNTQNALIASRTSTNSLISPDQLKKLLAIHRALADWQGILDQVLRNLQQDTERLHALAKEVLANDNKE